MTEPLFVQANGVRLAYDRTGRGGVLHPPVCALWGSNGPVAGAPVLELWQKVAGHVSGGEIANSAHYVQEEQPEQVADHILRFADNVRVEGVR